MGEPNLKRQGRLGGIYEMSESSNYLNWTIPNWIKRYFMLDNSRYQAMKVKTIWAFIIIALLLLTACVADPIGFIAGEQPEGFLPSGGQLEFRLDWSKVYGELLPGEYRIALSVGGRAHPPHPTEYAFNDRDLVILFSNIGIAE